MAVQEKAMKKMKRSVGDARSYILLLTAAVLLLAFALVTLLPKLNTVEDDDHDHGIDEDHGGYLTYIELSEVKTVTLTPKDGAAFTIYAKDDGYRLEDNCNPEELYTTVLYAVTLPYYKALGAPEAPLSDFMLDTPAMTITINDEITFSIGGMTIDESAYYVLMDGEVYTVDPEVAQQLLLPKEAYILRELWSGEPGDRPAFTEIKISLPLISSQSGGYEIIRNEVDDDAPLGLSRYELTSPMQFSCNDDVVREKVISCIQSIDLDEVAVGVELFYGECYTLTLKAENFDKTLYIGGVAPNGGRYLMLDEGGTVYIDMLGDYSFLDVTSLDLTYGLAFWLYNMDDVESITVVDNGRERFLPDDISDINARRFFVHVLNFSVAGRALSTESESDNRIVLKMVDGSVHELRFSQQNERQLAVTVDGEATAFACNIKDWQKIIEDLDALDAGKGIRED